jgi:hypothetical protein
VSRCNEVVRVREGSAKSNDLYTSAVEGLDPSDAFRKADVVEIGIRRFVAVIAVTCQERQERQPLK